MAVATVAVASLLGGQPASAATKVPVVPARPKLPVYVPPPVYVDHHAPILAALTADQQLLLDTHAQVGASIAANDAELARLSGQGGDSGVSARVARREADDLARRIGRALGARSQLGAAQARLDAVFGNIRSQSGALYGRPVPDAQADAVAVGNDLQDAVSAALAAVQAEAEVETDDAGLTSVPALSWPEVGFVVSQGFGPSDLAGEPPFAGYDHFHLGIDLAAPEGTQVLAPADGVVVLTGSPTAYGRYMGFGNYAVVDFGGGVTAIFGHMDEIHAVAGQHVARGQVIGIEGSTGYSTGPHLHFEVHLAGQPVDPAPLLKG